MADYNGFRRLSYYLRKMSKESKKELKELHKETADEVVDVGRAKAKSLGSTIGKAAPSIRRGTSTGGAVVYLGGGRYPYALGAELGSKQGPRKKQFELWRGNPPKNPFEGSAGYALFPSIRENEVPIKLQWTRRVDNWKDRTFPEII